ncbi:recombinase family protein [Streptomyces sp. 2323.1]|uniref:recombinase family protein n=1 Tax=Streptomyces sp. 2323.1 TaxID=1938841 RepID=UPI001331824A|nr:recombinase family protein [Streptomyces sp. 2323.1]
MNPVRRDRGHPGDRPRHHRRGQELVELVAGHLSGIEVNAHGDQYPHRRPRIVQRIHGTTKPLSSAESARYREPPSTRSRHRAHSSNHCLGGLEVPAHSCGGQVTLNLHDHLAAYALKRPGAYLRISSDRFGLETGVDRQLEDAEDTRARLRWGSIAKVYRENDTSAFKKRKVIKPDGSIDWIVLRPEFRQLLADLANGVIDGVIFYDLDRLVRQPRDLEDLIDIVEYVKRPVTGATGGRMNLINDSDRHMARMMCVMALKSSEDTARRVARTPSSPR